MKNDYKAYLLTLLVVLFWGSAATAFKLALRHITPYNLLFFSALVSFVILTLLYLIKSGFRINFSFNWDLIKKSALLGFLNPFLFYVLLFKAYALLPAQIAMTLNYAWPVMLTLFSVPILKQKLTWQQLIGVLVGFAGAVIIATKGALFSVEGLSVSGLISATLCTVVWAVYWLFNTRHSGTPLIKLIALFFFGILYTAVFSPFLGTISWPPNAAWPAIIYVGVFEMGITFLIWLTALKLSTVTARISILIYLAPFLSLLFLWFFLNEQIYISTFIGFITILSGIFIHRYSEGKMK